MNQYYTIMVVPEKDKGVKSYKIPALFFRSLAFFLVMGLLLLGILAYDYWKILQQVYENKHLSLENRQLKEQVQLFQMKMNTLSEDLRRINTFERKLRVITGLENSGEEEGSSLFPLAPTPEEEGALVPESSMNTTPEKNLPVEEKLSFKDMEETDEYFKCSRGSANLELKNYLEELKK